MQLKAVLKRVKNHGGLFAPLLTLDQRLPSFWRLKDRAIRAGAAD